MDELDEGWFGIIISRDLLTDIHTDIKLYNNII